MPDSRDDNGAASPQTLTASGNVWRDADRLPAELQSLAAGLRLLRGQGPDAPVVSIVGYPGDADTRRALAKRRHDVKAALRTLGFTVKALETGYRFDDDKAKAKIDAIAKAVSVLERESDLLTQMLASDP